MKYELFMAGRYLKARGQHAFISLITFISMGGVAVGVMALIVVIAVMAGFENHLRTKILGINAHVLVRCYGGPFGNVEEIEKKVLSCRVADISVADRFLNFLKGEPAGAGVTAVTPIVYIQALLSSGHAVSGVAIRGVDPSTVESVMSVGQIVLGRGLEAFKDFTGRHPPVILGKELARNLQVSVGQSIQVILPGGTVTPVGMIPKIRSFTVTGINSTGMYEYDSSLAFIPIDAAQKLLGIGDKVHGLEVKVSDIYAADRLAADIGKVLGFPFWTMDWQKMSRNLFAALKMEKLAMFIILTLIVLVAAFNIISTLIMMVMEKKQDIAILKAIGASDRQILRIFMLTGLMVGLIGTAIGVSGGVGLCWVLSKYKFIKIPKEVYYTDSLPILMNNFDVTLIAVSAVLICFLATIYPARQAARINPSEVLRTG